MRRTTVSIHDLEAWSTHAQVTLENVTITGHSPVHKLESDCEMHFGAKCSSFAGDPNGLVLEPMNLCIEPFFGKPSWKASDWTSYANTLTNKKVKITGVPRIWPEHLVVGSEAASNPAHAVEFHPLTKIEQTGKPVRDFSRFVYAPDGYAGGLSESSVEKILKNGEIGVTVNGANADIDYEMGRIENFTTVTLKFRKAAIEEIPGGHRALADVKFETASYKVHCITVTGSPIDDQLVKFKAGRRASMTFDALVLMSMCPVELYQATQTSQSSGTRKVVSQPFQMVVFGVVE